MFNHHSVKNLSNFSIGKIGTRLICLDGTFEEILVTLTSNSEDNKNDSALVSITMISNMN